MVGDCSFSQLLSNATAGALYQPDCTFNPFDSYGVHDMQHTQGYDASDDSDDQESEDSESDMGSDDQDSDVCFIDDNIPYEEFQKRAGIGSDSDEGPRGTDDTTFCDSEIEGETSASHQGVDNLSQGVEDIPEQFEENPECLLDGCGCAKHELTQEISTQFLENLKTGYKKR